MLLRTLCSSSRRLAPTFINLRATAFSRACFSTNVSVLKPSPACLSPMRLMGNMRRTVGDMWNGPYGEQMYMVERCPKWGFLIYRCDYRDDKSWEAFINGWSSMVKDYLRDQYDDETLADSLTFTVKDDRSSLNNASVEQIHKVFSDWTRSKEAEVEQKDANGNVSFVRYVFCVHVDARSLDGCLKLFSLPRKVADQFLLNIRDKALGEAAYVNIVRVEKEWYFPSKFVSDFGKSQDYGEEYEELEEEEEEEKGPISVKMHLPYVLPAAYTRLATNSDLSRWDDFTRDRDDVCYP